MRKKKEPKSLLEKFMKDMDYKPKRYLFGVNIRVGDLIPTAFDPNKEILVHANSTEEFMINLKNSLIEMSENPNNIIKDIKRELENKMSEMEIEYVMMKRSEEEFFN